MRLNRVQKKLKDMGVDYEYIEDEATISQPVTGNITFEDLEGNRYSVSEHTGSGAQTVQGIVTGGKDFSNPSWSAQKGIVNWLEREKERFVEV